MCGRAARPWADALAALSTDAGEPHQPTRSHALWALSRLGDARCVPRLVRRLAEERHGFASHPAVTETVRLLAETGADAAPARPALRAFLDADERPVRHGTWRSVPEDDALCEAARAALLAASAPGGAT
ncbi:hypothetical protein [Streptomyces sp. NBC_00328]|uniref:hypothetical protein n=1 Tax=Streptomyces sp. NBC_00328 TaxID=2903646 RepID=UPI002E2AE954|nr:hypothetical protein [Streptomyces sp. NBC_00328]